MRMWAHTVGQNFPNAAQTVPTFDVTSTQIPAQYGTGWAADGPTATFTVARAGIYLLDASFNFGGVGGTVLFKLDGSAVYDPGTGLGIAGGLEMQRAQIEPAAGGASVNGIDNITHGSAILVVDSVHAPGTIRLEIYQDTAAARNAPTQPYSICRFQLASLAVDLP